MTPNHHHDKHAPEPLDNQGPFESTRQTDRSIVVIITIVIAILVISAYAGCKWVFNTVKEEATQTLEQVETQLEPFNKLIRDLKKNTQKIAEYRDQYQALIKEIEAIPANQPEARKKKAQLLKELKAIFENGVELNNISK